jgi:Zinc knuckle
VADKAKEYGMNKLMPFTGNQTKIRRFLQDCLGYLDINQSIYNTDQLKIGFILSYMNDGEATNWKEYVDALTMEERGMLLRQGKCFHCKKTGHMAKDCPLEQGESLKQKKVNLARFAYTTIKALTKEQRESFTKMVMEDKDEEDF